ncbi:MAG: amino acid adenylation domain-containing protein, partial [Candidatus Saccharibacteria bacterium]|nr:amino acid adenylation domain-containing protein [Candidatus Saccharibacteria bacterium]
MARTPNKCAVVYEGTELTYFELERKTAKLASVLIRAGVKPDTLVGIFCERSLDMIVGILAILRAGGAYVPLDPDYPADRLAYLLNDSGVGIVLLQSHLADRLPVDNQQCFVLDEHSLYDVPLNIPVINRPSVGATDLAYMIYTSGTTGNPKGVMIEHRALVNRLVWMRDQFAINEDSVILQKTPYSFDVSVWELLLPFISGSKLVFAKPDGHKDGEYISRIIDQQKITTLHFVPSMLAAVLPELHLDANSSLKQVFCSGEALSIGLQNKFFEKAAAHIELHNLYGPTEAAIDVSWWQCKRDSNFANVPIGQPISNIKLYILNERLTPVSVNCIGELFIGGVGLARGYYNREDLTREKFIPNPFVNGERLYKTGDLARWLP